MSKIQTSGRIEFYEIVEVEGETPSSFVFQQCVERFEKVMQEKLGEILGDKRGLINLVIVDQMKMAELNERYRNKKGPTDVLSFAYTEGEEIEQGEQIALGDVFICQEVVEKQAKEKGHELEKEAAILFVHGLLHLIGFDHQDDEQEQEMENYSREILK